MEDLSKKHTHKPTSEPHIHHQAVQAPYSIRFQDELLSDKDLKRNIPAESSYPLVMGRAIQYKTKKADILHQYLSSYLYHIEIYEIDALQDLETAFLIERAQLFLFFMLDGSVTLTDPYKMPMATIQKEQFCTAYNREGLYQANYKKGKHCFAIITFKSDWYEYTASIDYPALNEFFQSFQNKEKQYHIMPRCKITKDLGRLLRKVHNQVNKKTKGETEAKLKNLVSKLLLGYNDSLIIELAKPSYKIKCHIDEQFHDSELKISDLAKKYFIEEQTLSRHFKTDYGRTPSKYLEFVRMQHSKQLLENTELQIKDVSKLTGHDDINAFGKKIIKFFNRTASDIQKAAKKTKFWKFIG